MSFGFDPSIILGARQFDAGDALRTAMDVRQRQAVLSDLLRKQQREATLADVLRQNADNPGAVVPALMRGGLGQEAQAWRGREAEVDAKKAAAQRAFAESLQKRAELLSRPLRGGVKSQEDLDRVRAAWIASGLTPEQLAGIPTALDEQSAPLFERLADYGLSGEDAQRAQHQGQSLEETRRHNLETEKTARINATRQRMQPLILVAGQGGGQFFVDPRNPNAPAAPIVGPDGKPILNPKPKPQKSLSATDRDALEKAHAEASNLDDLIGRFKDGYAGKGATGKMTVDINKRLGSWASEGAQEEANYWADFSAMVDIERRNKMFGATLSPHEAAAWEAAKNITPNSKPEVVRKALINLRDAARSSMRRRGMSLAKDGYNPEAIEVFTGELEDGGGEPGPRASPPGAGTGRRPAAEIRAEIEALKKGGQK
jgi:hypothetical protein